ncbi:MAG: transcriptional activator domain [Pseudonocardiales bacterium]|nr:transcriptional activator domain [Pseudonocardiales bacterium]
MLTVAILGAVEARSDGRLLVVPEGKTTELLARLALQGGSPVRAEALLDDLWPEGAGRNTLQSKVSQLRRALRDRDLVSGGSDGYSLVVEPGSVDAACAIDLASQSSAARRAGDPASALESAHQGLRLFRGDILPNAGRWSDPHRARLEETRLVLLEDAMAARVDLGSGGEIVGELETLVGQHPLRERLWASLMAALYRGGRQAEALSAYARVRRLLIDDLGVEPGAELRALERQLLRQGAVPGRSAAALDVATPGNLPSSPRSIVGRARDQQALSEAIATQRLVTLVGPAGVGKTRLLLEAARAIDTPGGVWLVRLEAVAPTADLQQVVAETLHLAGGEQLRQRLAGARTVLLLDNCEHVAAASAALAARLLADVPALRIVATSQVPLGIEDEMVHPVLPLPVDDSVALFLDRARDVRRQLVVDAETTALAQEVCRALDGLPLAIELAAARARSLSVQDIARRLDDRFALLQDPSSNRPARRRALSGAIAWSYDLLFPDDQRGLWALSAFAGSASLGAIERVLGALDVPQAAAVDTLTRLVDRSLVSVDSSADGRVRYRLLDSIRAYALDRLADAGLSDTAHRAHAEWYAQAADWCDAHVRGPSQPDCLTIAREERSNIDAALSWCATSRPGLGMRIANGLGWTWVVLGEGAAGAARIRAALVPETAPDARARAMLLAGWLEASAGDVELAQDDLDEAARLAAGSDDELDPRRLSADVARHRAFAFLQQGRPREALDCASLSLPTYRALDLRWESASALVLAAYTLVMTGDLEAAARNGAEAMTISETLGDSWSLVHATAVLGAIAQAQHRFDDAIEALTQAADLSVALGFVGQAAFHRGTLAQVQRRAGRLADSAASFKEALAGANSGGDGRMAATIRLNLAQLRLRAGDRAAAVALLRENLAWYGGAGGGEGALLSRCVLAAASDDAGDLEAVLQLARDQADLQVTVLALDGLARLRAEAGESRAAAGLIAEADALAPSVAHILDEADRLDRAAAAALAQVGSGGSARSD